MVLKLGTWWHLCEKPAHRIDYPFPMHKFFLRRGWDNIASDKYRQCFLKRLEHRKCWLRKKKIVVSYRTQRKPQQLLEVQDLSFKLIDIIILSLQTSRLFFITIVYFVNFRLLQMVTFIKQKIPRLIFRQRERTQSFKNTSGESVTEFSQISPYPLVWNNAVAKLT